MSAPESLQSGQMLRVVEREDAPESVDAQVEMA